MHPKIIYIIYTALDTPTNKSLPLTASINLPYNLFGLVNLAKSFLNTFIFFGLPSYIIPSVSHITISSIPCPCNNLHIATPAALYIYKLYTQHH